MKKKAMSRAMLFILLFGIVSMFSDMTKDSAESIRGAFLSLMGASAATIGLVSGLGEMAGYSLAFGLAWFLGSWALGALYDVNLTLMAAVSASCQILAIPFYILSSELKDKPRGSA